MTLTNLGFVLKSLKHADTNDEDVVTAKGKYQYPRSFKEICKKIWLLKK